MSESQWIQSAMGYNRDTTAFNYTQNATSIPSMQLDYSRFMDSVMTASQPTIKYPAYAASSPSSVQPTAQGAGGGSDGFLGSIENGLKRVGNYWHQMQDAYSQFKAVNPYAANALSLTNPIALALNPELMIAPLESAAEGLDWFNDTVVNPMMPVLMMEGVGGLVKGSIEYLSAALSEASVSLREASGIESELAGGVSSTADAPASKVSVSKFSFMRNSGQTSETIAGASDPAGSISREYTEAALEDSTYVVNPSVKSARKLKEFGLSSAQRRSFYKGDQVIFEDPSSGSYPTAIIFRFNGLSNTLAAGIYDVISEGGGALMSFASRARSLAGSLGASNLELFGADIQNERLAEILGAKGYSEGEPVLIDQFGFNKEVPTLRRTYDLSLDNTVSRTQAFTLR